MGWRERPSVGAEEEVGAPALADGSAATSSSRHLQLKPVISIIIHFTFGSSVLNTESHRTLGAPKAQTGRQFQAQFYKQCCPHVTP